jgi:hypothetical protein
VEVVPSTTVTSTETLSSVVTFLIPIAARELAGRHQVTMVWLPAG